jgi:trans-2,3-dihydro-3-hydroxyanthranilate isomerase
MLNTRRRFLQMMGASGAATTLTRFATAYTTTPQKEDGRRYQFVQIDVFSSHRLQGNPLAVFPDARGLSDTEMQDLARETNLQETTFVFPREPATEQQKGIKVRIFVPNEEIPFGGHPTLGTAMILRNRALAKGMPAGSLHEISLDLQVGRIPVAFRTDEQGNVFGEMHQIDPVFGPLHDHATVAELLDLKPTDLVADWPIQTVSTGLEFAIVPIRELRVLQALNLDQKKVSTYLGRQNPQCAFYFVTRDTQDPNIGLRSRSIFQGSEDPATGFAAGCAASWMVRYGIAQPGKTVHILQGVEIHRPSHIYVHADKDGDKIRNVRVGGNAIEVLEGEVHL